MDMGRNRVDFEQLIAIFDMVFFLLVTVIGPD